MQKEAGLKVVSCDARGYRCKGGGGGVVVCVLCAYCQSYSDLRRYSHKGGGDGGGW